MAISLDKKLETAIGSLNNKQKRAVLNFIDELGVAAAGNHWDDPEFVAEMDRRYEEYKSGKAKLTSIEEIEEMARQIGRQIHLRKAG